MDRAKEVYRTLTERERDRGDGGERERPKMNSVITQELLIISYSIKYVCEDQVTGHVTAEVYWDSGHAKETHLCVMSDDIMAQKVSCSDLPER